MRGRPGGSGSGRLRDNLRGWSVCLRPIAENRSETVSDLSENRSEAKVGDTRPGQEPKENTQRGFTGGGLITASTELFKYSARKCGLR